MTPFSIGETSNEYKNAVITIVELISTFDFFIHPDKLKLFLTQETEVP